MNISWQYINTILIVADMVKQDIEKSNMQTKET